MKMFTRCLLGLLLGATPLMAAIETASANTELVPAARLVAPYFDVSGSRRTLLMLTNASKTIDLITTQNGATFETSNKGVHIEFYDKNCNRTDRTVDLSASDIDQLDLAKVPTDLTQDPIIANKQGFIDIDVRTGDAQRDKPGIALNVLMGTVVISDFASDWAIAYPMASSLAGWLPFHPDADFALAVPEAAAILTGANGIGHRVVTGDSNGKATGWGSGYEPFPSRVFVPFYFAEGGPLGTASQLVIAAPADGNWDGLGSAGAERPGQALGTDLMSGTALLFDGCENKTSAFITSHWINNSLGNIFGVNVNQSSWKTALGAACKGSANFPSVDENSVPGAFIGWIDYPNSLSSGLGKPRGMVGLLIESVSVGNKMGDATRLWGDPHDGGREPVGAIGKYSFVDFVPHNDLD